jgi:hypothetical protein
MIIERKFPWDNVEINSIKDWKNRKKHGSQMPPARPKSVLAKPKRQRPNKVNVSSISLLMRVK